MKTFYALVVLIAFAAVSIFPTCSGIPLVDPWHNSDVILPQTWPWLNSCLSPFSNLALSAPLTSYQYNTIGLSSIYDPCLPMPC